MHYIFYVLHSLAPSPVHDAVVTLNDGMINVTWTPPVAPNGIIYQYIVQRVNSSGKFHRHVPANQHTISLPYFENTLVVVAAVNLYGQSNFKHAVPKGAVCNCISFANVEQQIVYNVYKEYLLYG